MKEQRDGRAAGVGMWRPDWTLRATLRGKHGRSKTWVSIKAQVTLTHRATRPYRARAVPLAIKPRS